MHDCSREVNTDHSTALENDREAQWDGSVEQHVPRESKAHSDRQNPEGTEGEN